MSQKGKSSPQCRTQHGGAKPKPESPQQDYGIGIVFDHFFLGRNIVYPHLYTLRSALPAKLTVSAADPSARYAQRAEEEVTFLTQPLSRRFRMIFTSRHPRGCFHDRGI